MFFFYLMTKMLFGSTLEKCFHACFQFYFRYISVSSHLTVSVKLFRSWICYFICCLCQAGMRSAAPGSLTRLMITATCSLLCPWESGLMLAQTVWIRVEIWSASLSRLNRASSKVSKLTQLHLELLLQIRFTHFWHSRNSAQIQAVPTGVSLWMGAHDSITEGGWTWTDGSPFRYINWAAGDADKRVLFHLSRFTLNGENNLQL